MQGSSEHLPPAVMARRLVWAAENDRFAAADSPDKRLEKSPPKRLRQGTA
jgi:hypothetical protein